MNIPEIERTLRRIARRYTDNPEDIRDLTQTALMTCWAVSQKKPDASNAYLVGAGRHAIQSQLQKESRQKRRPAHLTSFSAPIGNTDLTIEETIGYNDQQPQEAAIEALGQQFGTAFSKYLRKHELLESILHDENGEALPKAVVQFVIRDVPLARVPDVVDEEFFRNLGLEPFLDAFYDGSAFEAVSHVHPGKFLPGQFSVPSGYWKGEKGYHHLMSAVRGILLNKGVTNAGEIRKVISNDFQGLDWAMTNHFGKASHHLALKVIFPELQPWDFHNTSRGFYNSVENQRLALTAYLVDQGSKPITELTPEATYEQGLRKFVSVESLKEHKLSTLLQKYHMSVYRLFHEIFPAQILPWTLYNTTVAFREHPRETADQGMKWLIEEYFGFSQEELPVMFSGRLLKRTGFGGYFTNPTIGYRGSTYEVVNRIYPGVFQKSDFRRARHIIVPDHPDFSRPRKK
jgi:hypothetical protein